MALAPKLVGIWGLPHVTAGVAQGTAKGAHVSKVAQRFIVSVGCIGRALLSGAEEGYLMSESKRGT